MSLLQIYFLYPTIFNPLGCNNNVFPYNEHTGNFLVKIIAYI